MLALVAHAEAPPLDFNGVWMPTAIDPQGQRNQTWPQQPPFLPEVAAAHQDYRKRYNPIVDDAGRSCLPYGMPYQMLMVAQYPLEIVQTDDRITIIFELHNDVRRIFLDGRKRPADLLPSWMGYSIGRWEEAGRTLVIETTHMREGRMPRPHGPYLKVTEKLRFVDGGKAGRMIELAMTVDDPKTYSQPFTVKQYFRQYPNLEIGEYFCSEDLWRQNLSGHEGYIPWR
jgi:hypothetical protein